MCRFTTASSFGCTAAKIQPPSLLHGRSSLFHAGSPSVITFAWQLLRRPPFFLFSAGKASSHFHAGSPSVISFARGSSSGLLCSVQRRQGHLSCPPLVDPDPATATTGTILSARPCRGAAFVLQTQNIYFPSPYIRKHSVLD